MRVYAYVYTFSFFFLTSLSLFSQDPIPGACGIIGPNLLSNPEFDDGNTGFASDYNFFPDKICNFGDYTVTSSILYDPADNCFGVPTFNLQSIWAVADRNDPGTGNFMIIDPSAANGVSDRIWEQTVPICPNSEYVFSIFAKNVYFLEALGYSGVDPTFNFTINGVAIGDLYVDGVFSNSSSVDLPRQPQADASTWIQISARWISGNETSATITMNNLVGVEQGNDLAVDGAFFGRCGKANAVELLSGSPTQCVDEGTVEPITLTASPETNSSNWLYHEWVKDGVVVQADNSNPIPPYTPAANVSGNYFADYELRVYPDPLGQSCPSVSETFAFQETCLNIFPVEWLDFSAEVQNLNVLLKWSTASELNNQGFEIQVSTDGNMFRNVGWKEGRGNTQDRVEYSFLAEDLRKEDTYFRLKQIDFDGAFEYSSVIQATREIGIGYSLEIGPNPMQERSTFFVKLDQDLTEVRLDVYDSSGKLAREYYRGPLQGNQKYEFPFEKGALTPGMYLLRIQNRDFVGSKPFVIR